MINSILKLQNGFTKEFSFNIMDFSWIRKLLWSASGGVCFWQCKGINYITLDNKQVALRIITIT